MITNNDLRISNQSYTSKDFYQIYPELLELVEGLTERWSPASSNESDPGVVLLKLLAFIADKINYNIDKNILEAFMPSATQEDSMMKLCEMLGYTMHYAKSATCEVTFMWAGPELPSGDDNPTKRIELKKFETVITNDSEDINYVLTQDVQLTHRYQEVIATAIQGEYVKLDINSDGVLLATNIDSDFRFYMPERGIAENGIFITNSDDVTKVWEKKDNLNIIPKGSRVWKLGYDSKKGLPYIQFPNDVIQLIKEGLLISYIRTQGVTGNISARTLTKLVNTTVTLKGEDEETREPIEEDVSTEGVLIIQNSYATNNGTDIESIDEAYEGFKRTIGTFDTLVSCIDYQNAIYKMVKDPLIDNTPLTSNCQVSDIKDDINKAYTVVSFDNYGLTYDYQPETSTRTVKGVISRNATLDPAYQDRKLLIQGIELNYSTLLEYLSSEGLVLNCDIQDNAITSFELYIYPLKPVKTSWNKETYQDSFKPYYGENVSSIKEQLDDTKSICHVIKQLEKTENAVYLIKNYYYLNAKISTTHKVNKYEMALIKENIYRALYEKFNSRQLEYGEDIPYDYILEVIENADATIKSVSLDEPIIRTKYMRPDGTEGILSNKNDDRFSEKDQPTDEDKLVYLKLVAKNVLAGRAPLLDYNKNLTVGYNQSSTNLNPDIYGGKYNYYVGDPVDNTNSITALTTDLKMDLKVFEGAGYQLRSNELIKIIAPSLKTAVTYPMYVNYYFNWGQRTSGSAGGRTVNENTAAVFNIIDVTDVNDYNTLHNYTESNSNYIDPSKTNPSDPDYCIRRLVEKLALGNDVDVIYKRSKNPDYSAQPGNLLDEDRYSYTQLGTRRGAFYSSNWYYQNNTTYALDRSLLNTQEYCREGKNEAYYRVVKTHYYNEDANHKDSETYTTIKIEDLPTTITPELFDSKENEEYKGMIKIDTNVTEPVYEDIDSTGGPQIGTKTYSYARYRYTTGETIDAPYIPANTEYMLQQNDVLYINRTDNDGKVMNYKYCIGSNKKPEVYLNGTLLEDDPFCGIIKCNFDLYHSPEYHVLGSGHSYSKTTGFDFGTTLDGMFSLSTKDEINIRAFCTGTMKTTSYIYWKSNNNNSIPFTLSKSDDKYNYYEYILEDGEYLFYTNSAKTYLSTVGTGTKLIVKKIGELNPADWILNQNDSITLKDITKNGIGAFAQSDWIERTFTDDYTLTTQEMEISTAVEGDIISNLSLEGNDTYIDSTGWYKLNSKNAQNKETNLKINGESIGASFGEGSYYWSIKPILNLNIGPTLTQSLISYSTENGTKLVVPSIKLYTSTFVDSHQNVIPNEDIERQLEYGYDSIKESIYDTELAILTDTDLRCSYLMQRLGGIKLSCVTNDIAGKRIDDVYFYEFNLFNPKYNPYGDNDFKYLDVQAGIDLSKLGKKGIRLGSYVPKEHMSIFSIYVAKGPSTVVELQYDEYTGDEDNPVTSRDLKAGINFYRNTPWLNSDEAFWDKKIELKQGLNVIACAHSGILTITAKDNSNTEKTDYIVGEGKLTIYEPKLVHISTENQAGINYEYLGLSLENEVINKFLKDYIIDADTQNKFYYNVPIDNSMLIDVDTLDDPYSWTNYNNVCSKFTLSELDTSSLNKVDIAKASQI